MYYENFEELLKERNVTASKVAKATGISTATLTAWKKGLYTPKVDKLEKIADYFEVPLSRIVHSESEDFEEEYKYESAFNDFLNRMGWTITRTDYTKDLPCDECLKQKAPPELSPEDTFIYLDEHQYCEHCLLRDEQYIFSNGSITFNVTQNDYNAFARSVHVLCLDTIKDFINKNLANSIDYLTPLAAHDDGATAEDMAENLKVIKDKRKK